MTTIEMSFALSAPARRALAELGSPRVLECIAEQFSAKLNGERYRNFAVEPEFYTSPQGYRLARSTSQRPRGEKRVSVRALLTIRTLRVMKRLQTRGLGFTWQLEEMLFYAFQSGYLLSGRENLEKPGNILKKASRSIC